MDITKWMKDNQTRLIAVIAVIILAPLVYSSVSYLVAVRNGPDKPFLEKPDAKYQDCVRDTAYMRIHHMDLLKEIREEFVRHGIRGEIRLRTCAECHTSRERFCNRCHETVNLNLDCFGCHYYPEPEAAVQQALQGGEEWIDESS